MPLASYRQPRIGNRSVHCENNRTVIAGRDLHAAKVPDSEPYRAGLARSRLSRSRANGYLGLDGAAEKGSKLVCVARAGRGLLLRSEYRTLGRTKRGLDTHLGLL